MSIRKLIDTYLSIWKAHVGKAVFKVNLAITYACSAKCKTCNIWKIYKDNPKKQKEELSLSEYRKIAEKNQLIESLQEEILSLQERLEDLEVCCCGKR